MTDRTKFPGLAYAALRIVSGVMMALHGAQKLLGFPDPAHKVALGSQLGLGGIIELVGGALVALGLLTRPAALLVSGTMAVAYFQFTGGSRWTTGSSCRRSTKASSRSSTASCS